MKNYRVNWTNENGTKQSIICFGYNISDALERFIKISREVEEKEKEEGDICSLIKSGFVLKEVTSIREVR